MRKGKILIVAFSLVATAFLIFEVAFIYKAMYSEIQMESGANKETIFAQGDAGEKKDIVIRNGTPNSGKVTFSCNVDWGEENIPAMLEVFRNSNIQITFFVSGKWAEKHPELLRDMYLAGHEIQSHGYSHKLCTQVSLDTVKEEILKTEAAILDVLSIKTTIFAPPSGDYDEKTVALCKELGYTLALWSADTIDWREGSTAAVIKERVLKKELNGGIVLMHPKEETVKALPDLILEIQKKGLEIVPLYRLPL